MKVQLDIDTYKTKFKGGAKQYLFFTMFTFPSQLNIKQNDTTGVVERVLSTFGYGSNDNIFPYLVKSTTIPESTFDEIVIPYPGISFKLAGHRTYNDWAVNFNVDEEGKILDTFLKWHDLIYDPSHRDYNNASTYMCNQKFFLLDNTGYSIKEYTLHNAWPKTIGQVSFDYSSTDIATLDITFAYQYYDMVTSTQSIGSKLLNSLVNRFTGS